MILRSFEKSVVARPLFVFLRIQLAYVFGLIVLTALLAYLFPIFFPFGPSGGLLTGSLVAAHPTAMAAGESFVKHFGRAPTRGEHWRFVLVSTTVIVVILVSAAVCIPGIMPNGEPSVLLFTAIASLLFFATIALGYSLRPRHLHRIRLTEKAASPSRGRDNDQADRL